MFNTSPMNEEDVINKAMAAAKLVSPMDKQILAGLLADYTNVNSAREMFAQAPLRRKLIYILKDKKVGIINDNNVTKFLRAKSDDSLLTRTGVDLLSMVLLGFVLEEREYIEAAMELVGHDRIIQTLGLWLQIQTFPGE